MRNYSEDGVNLNYETVNVKITTHTLPVSQKKKAANTNTEVNVYLELKVFSMIHPFHGYIWSAFATMTKNILGQDSP